MSKIIFGNFANQLIDEEPKQAKMFSTLLSSRKIWYAQDGDMVVVPHPISHSFKQYACSITGASAKHIEMLCPEGKQDIYLALRVRNDANAYEALLGFARNHSDTVVDVYAQDWVTTDFFMEAGIPISPYDGFPSQSVLKAG